MRLYACAGWCESAHFAHAWRNFVWRGPIYLHLSNSVLGSSDGCSLLYNFRLVPYAWFMQTYTAYNGKLTVNPVKTRQSRIHAVLSSVSDCACTFRLIVQYGKQTAMTLTGMSARKVWSESRILALDVVLVFTANGAHNFKINSFHVIRSFCYCRCYPCVSFGFTCHNRCIKIRRSN